ncbi:MAG: hypothetical protein DRI90_00010 [Deltaproteobacteria bacterium]|nr:MAG: hypothetical protein DRI90_00010 [Deltaproteobacteria bacterium]
MTCQQRASQSSATRFASLFFLITITLALVGCSDETGDPNDGDAGAGGTGATGAMGGAAGAAGGGWPGGGGPGGAGQGGSGGQEPPPIIGPAGQFNLQINVDGVSRSYVLNVPQSAVDTMASGPVPILFALHGAGDNASNFIAATGLTTTASDNGFVLVGPNGYNAGWFVQENEGWPGSDGHSSSLQNDTQLLLDIMAETALSYYLDPQRRYAVGHSRGAGFTGLLATTSGQTTIASGPYQSPFAAYAINAGYDPAQGAIDPALAVPKRPVWLIHGSADSVVPTSYGQSFANALTAAGWDATWTLVSGASHTWLWKSAYGQTNQDLWAFFASHEL